MIHNELSSPPPPFISSPRDFCPRKKDAFGGVGDTEVLGGRIESVFHAPALQLVCRPGLFS